MLIGYALRLQTWLIDAAAITNLHLSSRQLLPGAELSLGIYNLLERRTRQPTGTDNWTTALAQDGRSVRLKMEARF